MRLAFVLLPSARSFGAHSAEAIVEAYARLYPQLPPLRVDPEHTKPDAASIFLPDGCAVLAALLDAPVPNREADDAAGFSLAGYGSGPTLARHGAHLAVVLQEIPGLSPVEALLRFTLVLASICEATDAVGVYWGGATHPARFFVDVATDEGLDLPVYLWTGLSVAADGPDRVGFLSLAMKEQLGVDDLLLTAPRATSNEGLHLFFDLLSYVAKRGRAPGAGETVGRSEDEKLIVSRTPSPVDPSREVWLVALPT
jgi:hypothetical protein